MVRAKTQFFLRAEHAFTLHPAQIALLDLEIARQNRTGKCDQHAILRFEVLRAAHNVAQRAITDVDLTD